MSHSVSRRSRPSSSGDAASCPSSRRLRERRSPSHAPSLLLLALVTQGAEAAHAQRARHEARVEAGVAQIEQPFTRSRSAVVLSGVRHHADSVLAGLVAANFTAARDSVAALQLIGALAWRPAPASTWQLEGGGSAALFQLTDAFGSHGNGSGWLRVRHQVNPWFGAMLGATVGNTTRGSETGHSNSVDLGAWATTGAFTFDAALSRQRTEDSLLMAASRIYSTRRSAWLDFQDLALSATWNSGPLDVSATQRWRRGFRGTGASQGALSGAATYAFTPHVSFVLTTGRHLADPVLGAPEATVTTAMLRLTFAGLPDATPPARESEVSIARMTDGSVMIVRVNAGALARVEIAGSFSGWNPVPITFTGGFWEAQVHVPPGRHRVAYRIDGGEWRAPFGLAPMRAFGGQVGLIVVP
jgi:hypothetical protein